MSKSRKKYMVIETSSQHTDHDLSPQVRTNVYGIYDSMVHAKKGFKDCLDIMCVHYNEIYDYKEAHSVLVKEEDYALVVKCAVRENDIKPYTFNSEMITIRIVPMR